MAFGLLKPLIQMSIKNPIIPPGSALQRSRPSKNSRLVWAVTGILAVHIFVLAGLLIQGCKRQDGAATTDQELGVNSQPSERFTSTAPNTPGAEQPKPAPAPEVGGVPAGSSHPATSTPMPAASTTPPAPDQSTARSTVSDAPTAALPKAPAASTTVNPGQEGGHTIYVTKSGDTLTKIAKAHGTTVKALRALNGLKTDRILVGQKIKVPTASPATGATDTSAPAAPK